MKLFSPAHLENELRTIQDKTRALEDYNIVSSEKVEIYPKNDSLQHILIIKRFIEDCERLKEFEIWLKPQLNAVNIQMTLKR